MAKPSVAFPALLLACSLLLQLAFAKQDHQAAAGYHSSCLKNMTEECGIEIFQNIFHRGPEITDPCCAVLLKFGHACHSEFILNVLSTGKFASREAHILQKSTAAWKRCRSIVKGK